MPEGRKFTNKSNQIQIWYYKIDVYMLSKLKLCFFGLVPMLLCLLIDMDSKWHMCDPNVVMLVQCGGCTTFMAPDN